MNTEDSSGRLPVHYAATKGHLEAVDYLLNVRMAKKRKTATALNTVLHCAIQGSEERDAEVQQRLVRHLIEDLSLDVFATDEESNTVLHCAVISQ